MLTGSGGGGSNGADNGGIGGMVSFIVYFGSLYVGWRRFYVSVFVLFCVGY